MGRRIRAGFTACAVCLAALFLLPSCEQSPQTGVPAVQLKLSEPCDVQIGCRASNEVLAATAIFATGMRALQPFPLKLLIDTGNRVDAASVTFTMQGMDMGGNRYSLGGDSAGVWKATVTLPVCSTRRTDWIADFDLLADGLHYRVQVPFVLEK